VARFELTASTSQTWRDTGLRYTPLFYKKTPYKKLECKDILFSILKKKKCIFFIKKRAILSNSSFYKIL
jgi:hypothetical protein